MTELLKLSLPVVLTYIGSMLMGFVDILLVGQVDAPSIGAVGVGTSLFNWFLVFGLGLSSGMEYLVSHAQGAGEFKKQREYLIQGVYLALMVSIPLIGVLVFLSHHLDWLGVNAEVLPLAEKYSIVLSFNLATAYLFNVFRLYLTAVGVPRPAMIALILGNLMNAGLGYVLILGNLGAPRLGAPGAAWATLITRMMMMLGIGYYLLRWERKNGNILATLKFRVKSKLIFQLVKVGLPAALQLTFEVGVFALATTLAAGLTVDYLAAHQIVLNISGLAFMVPLGISSATAVTVGKYMGRKNFNKANQLGWNGLGLGVGFMAFSCACLLIFPNGILSVFTGDQKVIEVGKSILLIAALFQLSDGIQTVGTGALRGLGETRSPMISNLFGHWLVGLPIGYILCFKSGWGLKGLWVGLSVGLTIVALAVFTHWVYLSRKLKDFVI